MIKKLLRISRYFLTVWVPNLVLVVGLVLLVQFGLSALAFVWVLISKWQMLRGGRKLWLKNLRDSGCDLVVAGSSVTLMILTSGDWTLNLIVAGLYFVWLAIIKPMSGPVWIGVQAAICQFTGLSVIFLLGRSMPQIAVVALAWLVGVISAEHLLAAHPEPARPLLAVAWGLIVAQAAWLFWHWLIFYSLWRGRIVIPQAALIIGIMGYVFGNIYLDHAQKKLGKVRLAEYVLLGLGLFIAIIIGTRWDTRL